MALKVIKSTYNEVPNPTGLPLNKLYIKLTSEQVKAIDQYWVDKRVYPAYNPIPNNKECTPENITRWLNKAEFYIKNLQYLLGLPAHIFWSSLLYDDGVAMMLDTFLRGAEPCYLPHPTGEMLKPYTEIYNLVILVYKRIFTFKMSATEHIEPIVLKNFVETKGSIMHVTLWDIACLYGYNNHLIITELLETAYEVFPQNELDNMVFRLMQLFETIGNYVYECDDTSEGTLLKLSKLLFDTAFSINTYLKLYAPFKNICVSKDVQLKLIHVYDHDIPLLVRLLTTVILENPESIFKFIENTQVEILDIFGQLMSFSLDQIIANQNSTGEQGIWVKHFLSMISFASDHPVFLRDCNKIFILKEQIETLNTICTVDQKKCKEIIDKLEENEIALAQMIEQETCTSVSSNNSEESSDEEIDEQMIQAYVDSNIAAVLDMFPHLGDGFVQKCLEEMDYDKEKVINVILEDKLPPTLAVLDRSLIRIPEETVEPQPGPSFVSEHFGKKPIEHKDLSAMLDDKSDVETFKEKLLKYRYVEDEMYNDDYDERFDSVKDKEDTKRNEYLPNINKLSLVNRSKYAEETDSECEEVEEEASTSAPKRDQFCEDPAVLRARREAKYQHHQTAKNRDVVGNPKGKGQDKTVQQNRDQKNTHKSSKANHNRRSGAQWKRSRGMVPS